MTTTYTISRTSEFSDRSRPHIRAYAGSVLSHSYFTFRTLAAAERHYPDKEFEKVGGHIRSVGVEVDAWLIDIEDLDDLMALYKDAGPLVIEPNWRNYEQPHIEIYDGYRE